MSLIVFFSTNEGIVIVGDRADAKVFGHDNHTVVGVTGPAGTAKVIADYAAKTPYDSESPAFWEALKTLLAGSAVDALFAHVPPKTGDWTYRALRVSGDGAEVASLPMPGVAVIGNDEVFRELESGKDPRFDDVRNETAMRKYFFPGRPCTLQEAVAFAKRLCVVTTERRRLLVPSDTPPKESLAPEAWLLAQSGWQRLKKI